VPSSSTPTRTIAAVTSGKRLLLTAIVASLVATAALAIGILLFGEFRDTEARILGTTAFLSLFSLLALPAGVLFDQGRLLPLAWATAALAVLGFAVAMSAVWNDDSDTSWKLTGAVGACALAATQTAGLASRLRPSDPPAVRRLFAAATALVVVSATMVNAAIWKEIDDETYYRFLAAIAVANVLLVVLQPVLRRGRAEPATYRLRLTLADGSTAEEEVSARDFAEAAAKAIGRAERDGTRVQALERVRS
jgi:hypothetical protein